MHAIIAYSRPRGKYGRYVFTVMIHFSEPTESANIEVKNHQAVYSCDRCGRWANINTVESLSPSEHRQIGALILYRYDNVEPGTWISIILKDRELLFYQETNIRVLQVEPFMNIACAPNVDNPALVWDEEPIYDVTLLNWDDYLKEQQSQARNMRVEEELIRQTMNAEQITITQLLLEPKGQSLEINGQKQFIEGELRYLS